MNRLEFREVLDAVGIDNQLTTTQGRYGTVENVHYWKELALWYGGSYYTIIKGRIPLEVANIIYQKYPGNPHSIRVDGGAKDNKPIDFATDDKYKKEFKYIFETYSGQKEYLANCQKAEKKLKRRNNSNKYLTTYHIDTKEGLLIFLLEMKDYYLRQGNMPETEVKKYDELIAQITSNIIRKVNPISSAYDWMQGSEDYKDMYNATVERDNKTTLGRLFRDVLFSFDNAVNPFTDESAELDDISEIVKRVKLYCNLSELQYRKGCCKLEIYDLEGINSTTYYRTNDGFSFQLHTTLEDEKVIEVLHFFSDKGSSEFEKGEFVTIYIYDPKTDDKYNIEFNITTGTIAGDNNLITLEQMKFIYDMLLKAVGYASSITIEKMKKQSNTKILV